MNNLEIIKVLAYLKPEAEYTFTEDDYSSIKWIKLEGKAPTVAELETALQEINAKEAQEFLHKQAKKNLLLAKLGITEDEAQLLLS